MHRIQGLGNTMTHATSGNAQATGEASASRCSVVGSGPFVAGSRPPARGGREFGLSLVAGIPREGAAGSGRQAHARTPAATIHGAAASNGEVVDPRRAARGVSNRSL